MSKKVVAGLFILLFAIITGVYFAKINHEIEAALTLIPPFLAAIYGFKAAYSYSFENIHGKAMAALAYGMSFFFIGELLFFLLHFVFNKDPFPSVADIFYLAAYPLLFLGFMVEIKYNKPRLNNFNKFALLMMFLISAGLAAAVAYFGIFKAYDPAVSASSNIIAMTYGVVDLIILAPSIYVLRLALEYKGGKLYNSWMLIFLGILLTLIGDILFALYNPQYVANKWPYVLIDLIWAASYMLFAYAFYYTAYTLNDLRKKIKSKKTIAELATEK